MPRMICVVSHMLRKRAVASPSTQAYSLFLIREISLENYLKLGKEGLAVW